MIRLSLSPTDKVARLKRLQNAGSIGCPVVRALQHIRAINTSAEFATLVGIETGTAMLLMTRIGYLKDNTPIELTDTYCRDDYYDFVAELRR